MFLLYSYINESCMPLHALSFAVFFSHQCNGTITLISAMKKMIEESKVSHKNPESLYFELCMYCNIVKGKNKDYDIDVGSSKSSRCCVSNNKIYSYCKLNKLLSKLMCLFDRHKSLMNNAKTSILKYKIYSDLIDEICNKKDDTFDGFGPFRSGHLVQLSSLLGLLPLDFYVHVPIHDNGGPRNFIRSYMNVNPREECLLSFNDSEVKRLQYLFNNTFTSNMFENASCIIGRSLRKSDVFFKLPWYDHHTKKLTTPNIQLMFRVHTYLSSKNTYVLQLFDGMTFYNVYNPVSSCKENYVMKYNKINWQNPNRGHHLNIDLLSEVYKVM